MSWWQTTANVFKIPDGGDDAVLTSTSTPGNVTILTNGVQPIRRIEASGITGTYRFLSIPNDAIEIYLAGGNALWIRGSGGSLQFDTDILLRDPNTTFRFNVATTDDWIMVNGDVAPSATGGTTDLILTSINTTSAASIAINGVISDYKGADPNATTRLQLIAGLESASDENQGTIQLAGLNDYTGPTVVNGATLVFNSIANWDPNGIASALGAPTNATDATIRLGATDTSTQENFGILHYTGSGDSSNRDFALRGAGGVIEAGASATGPLLLTGNVTPIEAGAKTFELGGDSSSINTFSGVIADSNDPNNAGTVSFSKSGSATWVLTEPQTFTGSTSINGGTLVVNAEDKLGAGTSLDFEGGMLRITGTDFSSTAKTINFGGGGFDIADPNNTFTINPGDRTGDLNKSGPGTLKVIGSNDASASSSTFLNGGLMLIGDGAYYESSVGKIGDDPNTSATLRVVGTDPNGIPSTYDDGTGLIVGEEGEGTIEILDGGLVQNTNGTLAFLTGSAGTVTVDGTDADGNPSWWNNSLGMRVGFRGMGVLNVTGGGLVTSNDIVRVGLAEDSSGTVIVDGIDPSSGARSTWSNADSLTVGSAGSGVLEITGGAFVTSNVGNIAQYHSSTGEVTVSGADPNGTPATWFIDANPGNGQLYVGGSQGSGGGEGTLTIGPDGVVVAEGEMKIWSDGTDNLQGGSLTISTLNHTGNGDFNWASGNFRITHTSGFNIGTAVARPTFVVGADQVFIVDHDIAVAESGSSGLFDINEGGSVTIGDALELWTGGTANLNGGALTATTINHTLGGTFNFNGGTLNVENVVGDLTQDGGTLVIGDSPGITDISQTYAINSGVLEIEILNGSSPVAGTDYDQLTAHAIDLAGTLELITDGYTPNLGDTFHILDSFFGLNGTFDTVLGAYLGGGLAFDLQYDANNLVLEVVSVTPGDFNLDGFVDGDDFLLWQTDPGIGNLSDWEANYGISLPLVANATTVPEPSSLVLALAGLALVASRRKR